MAANLKASTAVTLGFLAMMCWHFGTIAGLFGTAPTTQADVFIRLGLILGSVVAVAFICALTIQKHQGRPLLPDEREEKIERVSEGVGVLILYAGMLLVAWFTFMPLTPAVVVNGLLAVVSVAEFVKLLIVFYLHNFGAM